MEATSIVKTLAVIFALIPTVALAGSPTVSEVEANYQIQLGRALEALGQATLSNTQLRAEIDKLKETHSAEQKPEASPNNGGSSPQPSVRQESGNSVQGGKGVQSSGQGH